MPQIFCAVSSRREEGFNIRLHTATTIIAGNCKKIKYDLFSININALRIQALKSCIV